MKGLWYLVYRFYTTKMHDINGGFIELKIVFLIFLLGVKVKGVIIAFNRKDNTHHEIRPAIAA